MQIASGAARETPVIVRIRETGDWSWTSKSLFEIVTEPSTGRVWLDLLVDPDARAPVLSIPLSHVPNLPAEPTPAVAIGELEVGRGVAIRLEKSANLLWPSGPVDQHLRQRRLRKRLLGG